VKEGVASNAANNLIATETQPIEETTYEIVLHDSQAAARHLARILHLEVKHRPIEARRPTDDELAHRMADLLERARANGRREGARSQRSTQTMESHSEDIPTASQSIRSETPAQPRMRHAQQRSHLQTGPSFEAGSARRALDSTSILEAESLPASPAVRVPTGSQVSRLEKHSANSSERPSREGLWKIPVRNGLWNRVFNLPETLTFINPLRVPFANRLRDTSRRPLCLGSAGPDYKIALAW
jgi:hypothetical protein